MVRKILEDLAVIFKLNRRQAISISIETGIQNATLAITLATIALNNAEFSIVPAVYGLLMYVSGTLVILARKSLVGRHDHSLN